MPAGTPPIIIAARSTMAHSGRLNPSRQTVPPAGTPSPIRARATVRTSSA